MLEESLKSVINALTFGKIQEKVIENFGEMLKQGFNAAKKHNFPAHRHFKDVFKKVIER
jgi:hypothetical protein